MKQLFQFLLIFLLIPLIFLSAVTAAAGFLGTDFSKKQSPLENSSQIKSKQITLSHNERVISLPLEEYLVGVVAGEMPASFETEALKAQAIAARTYTLNRARFPNNDHPSATVCSNPAHCKAWISPEELTEKFRENPEHLKKIQASVNQTAGRIAVYNGEPISAVFHSTSSGMTENSRDVWGGEVPYLVSVVSEGEEASPRYLETKNFSLVEFQQSINAGEKKVNFTGNANQWFTNWERNPSGSVKSVCICNIKFTGTELRTLLSLRSTHFEIKTDNGISITTKGYGHGVGMSQYGANDMAKRGYTCEEILKKYYTGISLAKAY